MTDNDCTFTPPDSWVSPLGRLTSEAGVFGKHVADIATMIGHELEIGQIAAPSNTISGLIEKFSSESIDALSIMPRVDNFVAIADMPSSLLLDHQKSIFLSSDLVVGSTGSILASTASMAANVRRATDNICAINHDVTNILSRDASSTFSAQQQSILFDSSFQNSLGLIGDSLQSNVSTLNNLMDTSLATSRLNAEIFAKPIEDTIPYLVDVNQSFTTLNLMSTKVYEDLLDLQSINTNSFLFKAPTVEPYAAMRATAVLSGFNDETLDQLSVDSTDKLLEELGDELESRLHTLNPKFAEVYQEGIEVMELGKRGWIRHAGVSFRTLFDHLLRYLAPNSDLSSFFENPESNMINGEFSRNARLRYIFREVAKGSYAKMAEQDIKLAEATFFPSNDIVHKLTSPLSDKQMRVFCRRIQGSVSVVLEAAGY
ncbi:MAG: pPIWI-associating nuclease domain-containing protein [Planctomycetota bacterium]|jgi:hypothetical protein